MKNLNEMGLMELDSKELKEVEGGALWLVALGGAAAAAAAAAYYLVPKYLEREAFNSALS